MGGARSWTWSVFTIGACALALLACGRTNKHQHAKTTPTAPGAGGEAGAPAVEGANCAIAIDGRGGRHCAVYQDGSVWCWGVRVDGGPSDFSGSSEPQQVAGVASAQHVAVGRGHSCAWGESLVCWGNNEARQIDDSGTSPLPPTSPSLSGPQPSGRKGVGLGDEQTCSIDYLSHVYCRGNHASGVRQPSLPGEPDTTMPGPGTEVIDSLGYVVSLSDLEQPRALKTYGRGNDSFSPGTSSTCVVKRGGTLWCTDYKLDKPNDELVGKLALVGNTLVAREGDLFMCALSSEGRVWCEGFNPAGQVGNGKTETFSQGAFVAGVEDVRGLSVSDYSACALVNDGSVWCWGSYAADQNSHVPVKVSGCVDQQRPPYLLERNRERTDLLQRVADAGRLRAQAACKCVDLATDPNCPDLEDVGPNATCLQALVPDAGPYWECRAERFLRQAKCYDTSSACAPRAALPNCPDVLTCPELTGNIPHADAYCSRQSCSVTAQPGVKKAQICDGHVDCDDGTDERNCTASSVFECGGDATIPLEHLCDGIKNCADGSDEASCAVPPEPTF